MSERQAIRPDELVIRRGGRDDVDTVLGLMDGAVRWLAEGGRTGQWGAEPFSVQPDGPDMALDWATEDKLYLGDVDGRTVAALAIGGPPPFVPPPVEPEFYIKLLVVDRAYRGLNAGLLMIEHTERLARAEGVRLLRADCYAGDDRALLRHLTEGFGFTAAEPFTVKLAGGGTWPGQVIVKRLG